MQGSGDELKNTTRQSCKAPSGQHNKQDTLYSVSEDYSVHWVYNNLLNQFEDAPYPLICLHAPVRNVWGPKGQTANGLAYMESHLGWDRTTETTKANEFADCI